MLPNITKVVLSTPLTLEWAPLERHPNIEGLTLDPELPQYSSVREPQGIIDFSKMLRLRTCNMPWIDEWDSIRRCNWLESLCIRDSHELRSLDLSSMLDLKEVILESNRELRRVVLHDDAKVLSLKISQCPKLEVDLTRFVRDVEYLWLEGRTAHPLDDLGEAKRVKTLMLTFLGNRKEIPPFLHKLDSLEQFGSVGSRLSQADEVIERQFIERHKERNSAWFKRGLQIGWTGDLF